MVSGRQKPMVEKGFRLTPPEAWGKFFRFFPVPKGARIPPREPRRMSPREKIEEVLDAIRPAIRADGGDVELLEYREAEGVVEVRLLGACESCPLSMMTLREGIERRLKRSIPDIVEVMTV